jgi:hypothetical protein
VFDPSLFVEIRKRIGHEQFDQLNSWIIRTKLTPYRPAIYLYFFGFSRVFCVTFRQMLTPIEVAKWVAKSGAY